ncbi:radical SAM protein [Alicyclobacillaceae bacterium I2511]|nr:radical SAM protein [Alicyclobacillaceae bacterium I2511]
MERAWGPSKYNVLTPLETGELLVYNTYTQGMAVFSSLEKPFVLSALSRTKEEKESTLEESLKKLGFLVSNEVDEIQRVRFLEAQRFRTDILHLVLLPTEQCNFRCTYCYQNFERGKMTLETISGLKHFVGEQARFLREMSVSWFGGEPLLAPEVILELSQEFLLQSRKYGVDYSADISTNGYFLDTELFQKLLQVGIQRWMITLDGPERVHDERRKLMGGGGTFQRILENLKQIKNLPGDFEIHLRINFDHHNLEFIPEFIQELGLEFSADSRFQVMFQPVGRWGGAQDDRLPICEDRLANMKLWDFANTAISEKLHLASVVKQSLGPGGSVCYAAKPYSLVVGANGALHKCTCALDEEINQVGQLFSDGTMEVDYDKMAQWVNPHAEEDKECQRCYFRPSCQGDHCPLYRMWVKERPCPFEKKRIHQALQGIVRSGEL